MPTVTHKVLFVLLILAHERRRLVHFNVTEHPTAAWTAQQVIDAFPWDEAPRYLLRDRDRVYGASFRQRVQHMGIEEVLIAPRSPWQNPYVERLIGSIRRECLDHVIVLHEHHLRRLLTEYFSYYHPGARIGHWTWMRLSHARCNRWNSAPYRKCQRSVGCIIMMNDGRHDSGKSQPVILPAL